MLLRYLEYKLIRAIEVLISVSSMGFPSQCFHKRVSIFVEESGWTEEDGNKMQLAEFVSKILKVNQ